MADIQSTTDRLIAQAQKNDADSRKALLAESPNIQMNSAGTPLGLVSSGSDLILQSLQAPGKRQVAQENQNRLAARFNEQQDYDRNQTDKQFDYTASQDAFKNGLATNRENRLTEAHNQDLKFGVNRENRESKAAKLQGQLDQIKVDTTLDSKAKADQTKLINDELFKLKIEGRKNSAGAQDKLKNSLAKMNIPTFSSGEIDYRATEDEIKSAAKERGLDLKAEGVKDTLATEIGETNYAKYSQQAEGVFNEYRTAVRSQEELRSQYEGLQEKYGSNFTDEMVNSAVQGEIAYRETKAKLAPEVSTALEQDITAFTNEANIKLGTLEKQEAALIQQSDALGQELISTASMTNDQKAMKLKEVVSSSMLGDNKTQDNLDELLTDIDKLKVDGKPLTFAQKLSFAKQASINEQLIGDLEYNNEDALATSIVGNIGTPKQQKERLGRLQSVFDNMSEDVLRYSESFNKMEQFQRDKIRIQNSIDNYKTATTAEYKLLHSKALSDKYAQDK